VNQIVVFGTELKLPQPMEEEEVKKNLISILRDIKPELAEQVENTEYSIAVQDSKLIIYRLAASFG